MSAHFPKGERLAIAVPEDFVSLVSTVADIALAVSPEGKVEDLIWGLEDASRPEPGTLLGQPLEQVVTEESRPKVREMIAAALDGQPPRWRELNHAFEGLDELPVRYQAIRLGETVLFLGREMRAVAALQSRLVNAQRTLDEHYGRLRQLETRSRVLMQTSTEPMLVVDARSRRIEEANAAAARLLGSEPAALAGQAIAGIVAETHRAQLQQGLERIVATGVPDSMRLERPDGGRLELAATVFRAADSVTLLCRLRADRSEVSNEPDLDQMLAGLVARIPDAVVLTDAEARILWCNDAFLGLAEVVLLSQIRDRPLERFLGRPGVDVDVIIANTREHGRLRSFLAELRGAFGSVSRVEVSAATVAEPGREVIGFVLRDLSRHDRPGAAARPSPEAIESMMHLVGTVPLKELVRASTEEIEKMCIETALEMTSNNRASAAEMLGLSRQSLYVKLRRFDLIGQGEAE